MIQTNKVRLNKPQIDTLLEKPETGMGYQEVTIKMKNGDVFEDRIVLNSEYLVLGPLEKINPNNIKEITV